MHYLFLLLIIICLPLQAIKNKKEQMLCELDTLANCFEVSYGLANYKNERYTWDLASELEKARNKILLNPSMSTKEFHQVLRQFCQSTRDYHVTISFCATENSALPFFVKEADDRYFLMDESGYQAVYEITKFNGLPIQHVVESLQDRFFHCSNGLTDRAFATMLLTFRHTEMGIPAPKGKVDVTFNVDGTEVTQEFEWDHQDELIAHTLIPMSKKKHEWRRDEFRTPYSTLFQASNLFASPDSFVPALGKSIWTAPGGVSNPFNGNIYKLKTGEKIGYLRIPHYSGNANDAKLFGQIIAHLEKATDVLVIDQTGNPGGYVSYLASLTSMLIDEPIHNFHVSFLLNQEEMVSILGDLQRASAEDGLLFLNASSDGYTCTKKDLEAFKAYNLDLLQSWNDQKLYSDMQPYYGFTYINPHPKTRYTKPIIILVDELCFSCGDIFPALMQDNKRALIFGQTTAGAGGSVQSYDYPNHFGVYELALTRSIIERPNGELLENIGVTPDIFYKITPEDYFDGYSGYKDALIQAIHQVLGK